MVHTTTLALIDHQCCMLVLLKHILVLIPDHTQMLVIGILVPDEGFLGTCSEWSYPPDLHLLVHLVFHQKLCLDAVEISPGNMKVRRIWSAYELLTLSVHLRTSPLNYCQRLSAQTFQKESLQLGHSV